MPIDSRNKGARYERYIAKRLREYGYEAERGCQHSGGKDSPDVKHNMPKLHLELKNVEHLNLWNALEQSQRDAGEDEVAAVVFKRNRSRDYVCISLEDFMMYYMAWERELNANGREEKNR